MVLKCPHDCIVNINFKRDFRRKPVHVTPPYVYDITSNIYAYPWTTFLINLLFDLNPYTIYLIKSTRGSDDFSFKTPLVWTKREFISNTLINI